LISVSIDEIEIFPYDLPRELQTAKINQRKIEANMQLLKIRDEIL